MFFRKKGQMDESKGTIQDHADDVVEELDDDQLDGITGGVGNIETGLGVDPSPEVVVDDAYGKYQDMPPIIM